MKTIKLLSLLFSTVLIVGACGENECKKECCKNPNTKCDSLLNATQLELQECIKNNRTVQIQEIKGACTLPFDQPIAISSSAGYRVKIDHKQRKFLLTDLANSNNNCEIQMQSNKYYSVYVRLTQPGNIRKIKIEELNSRPAGATYTAYTVKGNGVDTAAVDIVTNTFWKPNPSSDFVYKIIGADDHRDIHSGSVQSNLDILMSKADGYISYIKFIPGSGSANDEYEVSTLQNVLNPRIKKPNLTPAEVLTSRTDYQY
jgi:hypothetical protein